MKYALNYSFILLLFFFLTDSFGQSNKSIQNNNYEWHFKKECWAKNSELEIFKVIETPPLMVDVNQKKIKSDIKEIIKNSIQNSAEVLEFKIQVFTIVDHGVCIGGILVTKETSEKICKQIYDYVEKIENINLGKQGGREKNCLSEIYIKTKKNKLKALKFTNLKFAK